MPEEKAALHAYLSFASHAAWQTFSEGNGVSVTGLLESLGLTLLAEMDEAGDTDIRQPWVKEGRKIDAQRRRRGGQQ